ncbi:uncharacterized protein A4U43_C08F18470, partial [Asparagus officinalis]
NETNNSKIRRRRSDRRQHHKKRTKWSYRGFSPQVTTPLFFALESRSRGDVAPSGPQTLSRRKIPSSASPSPSSSSSSRRRNPKSTPDNFPFWQQTWFLVLLLLMAFSLFAIALFLFLSLDAGEISPASAAFSSSSASSSGGGGVEVTYGSLIKLMHEKTKFRLHSHDVPYGSGSGQQSVTGFPDVDDANSYW